MPNIQQIRTLHLLYGTFAVVDCAVRIIGASLSCNHKIPTMMDYDLENSRMDKTSGDGAEKLFNHSYLPDA